MLYLIVKPMYITEIVTNNECDRITFLYKQTVEKVLVAVKQDK